MNQLVIFDVDGTLVKGQSQRELLKFFRNINLLSNKHYFVLSCWFIFYKTGFARDPKKIMEYAISFFKNRNTKEISDLIEEFFNLKLKSRIYTQASFFIKKYQDEGKTVILASNAIYPLIKVIAAHLNISHVVATSLEEKEGIYTGKITNMTYGFEKLDCVKIFSEEKGLSLENAIMFSDHISDLPLLMSVGQPLVVNPERHLRKYAMKNQWQILTFNL